MMHLSEAKGEDLQTNKVPVTVVVIILNEAQNLRALLPILDFAEEVIVVDSGSTDGSIDIVNQYGRTLVQHPFTGYGEQKRFGVALAKNDWILNVDADEHPTLELVEEIKKVVTSPADCSAYYLQICDVFMGRPMRRWRGVGSRHVRLFRKSVCNFTNDIVHEKVSFDGPTKMLEHEVHHYSYANIEHYLVKFNNYTSRAAKAKKLKKSSPIKICIRTAYKFFDFYVLKGYLINGYPGFVWSFLSSFYVGIKLIKNNELNPSNE